MLTQKEVASAAAGSRGWPRWSRNTVPWPHAIGRLWPMRFPPSAALVSNDFPRVGLNRPKLRLPFGPQSVHVGMKHKKQWVFRSSRNARDRAARKIHAPIRGDCLPFPQNRQKHRPARLFRLRTGRRSALSVSVSKSGRRTIPCTPSVAQNWSGLLEENRTVPSLPDSPMKSWVNNPGAGLSKRQ